MIIYIHFFGCHCVNSLIYDINVSHYFNSTLIKLFSINNTTSKFWLPTTFGSTKLEQFHLRTIRLTSSLIKNLGLLTLIWYMFGRSVIWMSWSDPTQTQLDIWTSSDNHFKYLDWAWVRSFKFELNLGWTQTKVRTTQV